MTDKIIAEIIFIKRYLCVIGTFPFIIRYAAAVCDFVRNHYVCMNF